MDLQRRVSASVARLPGGINTARSPWVVTAKPRSTLNHYVGPLESSLWLFKDDDWSEIAVDPIEGQPFQAFTAVADGRPMLFTRSEADDENLFWRLDTGFHNRPSLVFRVGLRASSTQVVDTIRAIRVDALAGGTGVDGAGGSEPGAELAIWGGFGFGPLAENSASSPGPLQAALLDEGRGLQRYFGYDGHTLGARVMSRGGYDTTTTPTLETDALAVQLDYARTVPGDCVDVLESGEVISGTYEVDLDGRGGADPYPVYCDLQTNGGGWTLCGKFDRDNAPDRWSVEGGFARSRIHADDLATIDTFRGAFASSDCRALITRGATQILSAGTDAGSPGRASRRRRRLPRRSRLRRPRPLRPTSPRPRPDDRPHASRSTTSRPRRWSLASCGW